MRRHGRGSRVVRGAVAASVATFVALVSHVSAGGAIPGLFGLIVPLASSFVVCAALSGRRVSAWRLTLAVLLSQALFHLLFVLGSYELAGGGHVHGAAVTFVAAQGAPPAVSMDATMAVGHVFAAAVTAVALYRGERTLAALGTLAVRCVAWVRARVRARIATFGPTPVRRVFAAVVASVQPVSVVVTRASARRGPPVAAS